MAYMITDDCLNCGTCIAECPNMAIYQNGDTWELFGETHPAIDDQHYYIVPDKCTECAGFHDVPQCVAVCPTDACVADPNFRETPEALLEKKRRLEGQRA
ncbi:MAG: 4Fe-4S dicluster domain-containing protein [Chlorobiales bacterium]|jgi:ferredoxin|nr:4Fe-4S dicluster domain-containing protein [Chlorobiales bacterium]